MWSEAAVFRGLAQTGALHRVGLVFHPSLISETPDEKTVMFRAMPAHYGGVVAKGSLSGYASLDRPKEIVS